MMKKLICLILCLIFCLPLVACGGADEDIKKPDGGNSGLKPSIDAVDGIYIVDNGASDYQIVTPKDASDTIMLAAGELKQLFEEATGINLSIINDQGLTLGGKYISIGKTQLLKDSGVSITNAELGSQGFKIERKERTILCAGDGDYGTMWSVYDLLGYLFNFESYSPDTYSLNKKVLKLPMYEFKVVDRPVVEYRATADPQTYHNSKAAHRFRFNSAEKEILINTNSNPYHNCLLYVKDKDGNTDPDFLSTSGDQLCYLARGKKDKRDLMLETALTNLKRWAEENPQLENIMLGISDNTNVCMCDACKASKEKYGVDSAVAIQFCNDLHDKLVEYYKSINVERRLNIVFFAYMALTEAPAVKDASGNYVPIDESVKCHDGVYVMYAPIYADYTYDFYHKENSVYFDTLKKWSVLSDEIYLWLYHVNFKFYLVPYNSFEAVQNIYKMCKDYNVKYMFDQGRYNAGNASGFGNLREWLSAKLSWNSSADINKLYDAYFDNMFGDASDIMRGYFENLRNRLVYNQKVHEMPGGIYDETLSSTYWAQATLLEFLDEIDKAYIAIEPLKEKDPELYKKTYGHILTESLSLRYMYLKLYGDSSEKSLAEKSQFLVDCSLCGVIKQGEGSLIDKVFE